MKQRVQFFFVLLLIFFGQTITAKADIEKAKRSYKNKDYQTAYNEYISDAEQGVAEAQFYVGFLYDLGRGVPKNKIKAKEWYLKAAAQGYLRAMNNIGVLYSIYDYSTPQTEKYKLDKEAEKWFRKAAEQGYAASQYWLAVKYLRYALGSPSHQAKAEKWLLKSAEQGFGPAQYDLGIMYRNGQGKIIKDINKARDLFTKSAEQGDARAQQAIGFFYYEGEGVSKDLVLAYMWFTISAEYGLPMQIKFMQSVENELTFDQINNAKKMASEWSEKHPPSWK